MSTQLRAKLIRLAASKPKGSSERKALLDVLAWDRDLKDDPVIQMARRTIKGPLARLTGGRYSEHPSYTPTVLGHSWYGELWFGGYGRHPERKQSWVRVSVVKGEDGLRGKPGYYHISTRAGIEDLRGNRGDDEVPGAPSGWVAPRLT